MFYDLSFALGVLLGFIYTLAICTIIISLRPRNEKAINSNLGDIRRSISAIQQDLQKAEKQIWDYGMKEEDRSRKWAATCSSMAAKAVGILQSCWQGRQQDETARTMYNALLTGLSTVGISEIHPNDGDIIEENDLRYRINNRTGSPPYRITKVVYPGYYFRTPATRSSKEKDGVMLLEPAVVDVETVTP